MKEDSVLCSKAGLCEARQGSMKHFGRAAARKKTCFTGEAVHAQIQAGVTQSFLGIEREFFIYLNNRKRCCCYGGHRSLMPQSVGGWVLRCQCLPTHQ